MRPWSVLIATDMGHILPSRAFLVPGLGLRLGPAEAKVRPEREREKREESVFQSQKILIRHRSCWQKREKALVWLRVSSRP
jgi:hypothetical protein